MVRAGQFGIECQVARPVWAVVEGHDDICSTTRNIFVDRLADARLKLGQIAR